MRIALNMTYYSRQDPRQAAHVEAVYAAMKKYPEGKPIPPGALTRDTGLESKSVISALELLMYEGKIEQVLKVEYKVK